MKMIYPPPIFKEESCKGGDACIALAGVAFTRRGRPKGPHPAPHRHRPYATDDDHPINLPLQAPRAVARWWGEIHISNVFPLAQESILSWVYELPEPGPTSQRVLYVAQS